MKRLLNCFAGALLLAPWLSMAAPASLEELQRAGRLELSAQAYPARGLVPGQKSRLVLEIATDRWFSGGTRIRIPEVTGLVILQTEQFASNYSENRSGQSWVIQRWTLDVFPQRPGTFTVPPIALELAVYADDAGNISGQLASPSVQLEVGLPDALAGAEQWVAAPSFEVEQRFDRALDDLSPGDAFERQVIFQASDVMAMMLPAIEIDDMPGLATYPSPPKLENRSNRGETIARRSQRISYVVETAGEYLLPGEDFLWWDTEAAQMRVISLAPVNVTAGAAAKPDLWHRLRSVKRGHWLAFGGGLLGLAALAWLLLRAYPHLSLARDAWLWLLKLWKGLRAPALPDRLNP